MKNYTIKTAYAAPATEAAVARSVTTSGTSNLTDRAELTPVALARALARAAGSNPDRVVLEELLLVPLPPVILLALVVVLAPVLDVVLGIAVVKLARVPVVEFDVDRGVLPAASAE